MQNQTSNPGEFSMRDAMRMANSPAGKQLLQLLRQSGGKELQQAMEKASAGDLSQAKQAISSLLENPDIQKLLEQMGR